MRGPKKAIVRSQNGAAKGRGCWERSRWPDAKLEVGSAKRALRNDQQRENEKREEKIDHKNSRQNFEERSAKGALRNEQQVLRRDGRKQREERREKRANGRQLDSLHFYRALWPPRKSLENQSGPPKWPPARIPAFLRCPVTTSMRTPKTATSVRGSVSRKC